MWKRVIWDILCIVAVFVAPWWVTLFAGILGVVFFEWFLEILFLGALYDALYGGMSSSWYQHLVHTGIFTVLLFVGQIVRKLINI